MTILFRYLLREHVKFFMMCFAGLMTIYLVIDFFEKVRKFLDHDVDLFIMLVYFLLKTPGIAFQMAPLAILMATLLTLGMFSKNHEITAMRSCGISLSRVAAPFLLFSLFVALVLLGFSAVIIPLATTEGEYIRDTMIEGKIRPLQVKANRPWIQLGNGVLMNFDLVETRGRTIKGITLYQLDSEVTLSEITEAKDARYTAQGWTMHEGTRRRLLPNGGFLIDSFESEPLDWRQTPDDFFKWLSSESKEMTLAALGSYVDRLRKQGYKVSDFLTDYYGRIAFPFVCVVMAVVGLALSLRRSGLRTRGMALGIGQALAIGFLYWTTHSVGIALGRSGALAPMMAGWIANVVFLSFGFYMYLHVKH